MTFQVIFRYFDAPTSPIKTQLGLLLQIATPSLTIWIYSPSIHFGGSGLHAPIPLRNLRILRVVFQGVAGAPCPRRGCLCPERSRSGCQSTNLLPPPPLCDWAAFRAPTSTSRSATVRRRKLNVKFYIGLPRRSPH